MTMRFAFLLGLLLAMAVTFADGVQPPVAITDDLQLQALVASEEQPAGSVVVTACSLVVSIYVMTGDGKLYRFSHGSSVSSGRAEALAFRARMAERLEVGCAALTPPVAT